MNKIIYSLYLFIAFVMCGKAANANHLTGMEITYATTSTPGTVVVTMRAYRDCSQLQMCGTSSCVLANCTKTLTIYGASGSCTGTNYGTFNVTAVTGSGAVDVVQLCPQQKTVCSNCNTRTPGTFTPGMEVIVFQGTVNLIPFSIPSSCCKLAFVYGECCRNSTTISISGAGSNSYYSEAIMDICAVSNNSSPQFSVSPTIVYQNGLDVIDNVGAFDSDGDSLAYSWGPSKRSFTQNVTYATNYSATVPFPFLGFPNPNQNFPFGLRLAEGTGNIWFRPNNTFVSNMVVQVTEYRKINGVYTNIGSVRRDVQINSVNGTTNTSPETYMYLNGVYQSNWAAAVNEGSQVCVTFWGYDFNSTDTTDLEWNNPSYLPGATFTPLYTLPNRPVKDSMLFCWTAPNGYGRTNPYYVYITGRDRKCPVRGKTCRALAITVNAVSETYIDSVAPVICRYNPTTVRFGSNQNRFANNNLFSLELSNSSGSFSSPTVLASKADTAINSSNNTFSFTLPPTIASGNYKLRVTSSNPVLNFLTTTIRVTKPDSNVVFIPLTDTTRCEGDTIRFRMKPSFSTNILKVYKNNSYLFTTSDTILYVTSAGSYKVESVDTAFLNSVTCEYSSRTYNASFLPPPSITILGADSFSMCTNGSVLMQATQNTQWTYQWKLNNTDIPGATTNLYLALQAGSYTVKATLQPQGCINTSVAKRVNVVSKPTVSITSQGNQTSFCQADSLLLTGYSNIAGNYSWLRNGTPVSGATSLYFKAALGGAYRFIARTDSACADTSSTLNLLLNPSPNLKLNVGNIASLCAGNSFTMADTSAPVTATYVWKKDGSLLDSSSNSSRLITSAGVYHVSKYNNFGCKVNSGNISVSVKSNPVTTTIPSGTASFCDKLFTQLSATPQSGATYQWKNSLGVNLDTALMYRATQAGSYYVKVTKDACTDSSAVIVVSKITLPNVNVSSSSSKLKCSGGSVLLTALAGSGHSYQWFKDGFPVSGAVSSTYSVTSVGTYRVSVKSTSTQCVDTSTALSISNATKAAVSIVATKTSACAGDSIVLASSASNATWTYRWIRNGIPVSGSNTIYFVAKSSGSYQLGVIDTNNCDTVTPALALTFNTNPTATINAVRTNFCDGDSSIITSSSTGATAYQWFLNSALLSGATGANHYATLGGAYYVKVTNAVGCSGNSNALNMVLDPAPSKPVITQLGNTLTANGSGYTSYQWTTQTGTNIFGATTATFTPSTSGIYKVKVGNGGLCFRFSDPYQIYLAGLGETQFVRNLELYPNPTGDDIFISFDLNSSADVVILLTDIAGKEMLSETHRNISRMHEHTLSLSTLKAGVYFVTLHSGGQVAKMKFVKTN